ncbi:NOT2 / NOT3 / NOT5 family isoform X2 [Carex rostrata]
MSGLLNPNMKLVTQTNLNGATSNIPDSTGRPYTASFSAQAANVPSFHHSGLHNIHGNFNLPNMAGSMTPRNAAMSGIPTSGVQQPGGSISTGRFTSNNLPVAMSQIPHGHTGGVNRGGLNIGANPAFSSGSNAIGGSMPGMSNNMGTGGNRSSVPGGMTVNTVLGNMGPRINSSVGNMVGTGSAGMGRTITSGGVNVPGITSRMNLTANAGSGNINVQGSNRLMSGMLPQGGPQLIGMLGSSYGSSGGTLSQNQVQGGNNALSSVGMLHDVNSSDTSPFDINDFPQLTGRPSSAGGPQGQFGNIRKQGVGVSSIVQQNQEFSIQNEDFPALPGYKGTSADYSMDLHHKEQLHDNVSMMQAQHYSMPRTSTANFNMGGNYTTTRQQHQQGANAVSNSGISFTAANNQDLIHMHNSDLFSSQHGTYHSQVQSSQNMGLRPLSNPTSSIGTYEQLIQQYQQPQSNQSPFRLQQMSSAMGQSYRDQSLKSIQGPSSPQDPHCLLGLLPLIRGNEPDLATLALGIDLTTLGLNLNSNESLYKNFGSPWSTDTSKGDPEFHIPSCYCAEQPPPLQTIHFTKFQSVTLFYIFYSMPKDEAQLYAANELYNRGWFYHRDLRAWLTRVPNVEPVVKTQLFERGSYFCFDPTIWDTIRKESFVLQYECIEKRPVLQSTIVSVR